MEDYCVIWKRFWRLVVTSEWEKKYFYKWYWKRTANCLCDCWKETNVTIRSLLIWDTTSCGCFAKEMLINRQKTHNLSKSRIYTIYIWINKRCNNKMAVWYKYYWWRWISLLRKDFDDFYKDMWDSYNEHIIKYWVSNTSIDRIDVNWHYCKDNCRWATKKEQSQNKRNVLNI